jgi:hypothetical protein
MSGTMEEKTQEALFSWRGGNLHASHYHQFAILMFILDFSLCASHSVQNDTQKERSHSRQSVPVGTRVFFRQDFASAENNCIRSSKIVKFFSSAFF